MGEWGKLLDLAKRSPNNVRFNDLCKLAELAGFIPKKKKSGGSHIWYKHPGISEAFECGISLQKGKSGKAKYYQVKQLVGRIEKYDLGPEKEED